MFPATLDHLRVEWMKWASCKTTCKLLKPSGMGLLVRGAGSHPFNHLWCGEKDVPTGVNLNKCVGKIICSWVSSRNSVEVMVRRRVPGNFPSSIQLDHGGVLAMDGVAQSEHEHSTASKLQNLAPNVCARFSRARFSLVGGIVPLGLGDGVDVAKLPKSVSFCLSFGEVCFALYSRGQKGAHPIAAMMHIWWAPLSVHFW